MTDEARDPTFEDLLDVHGQVLLDNVHVMLPGQVVSYDAGTQLAAVQPLVQHRHLAEDGETVVVRTMPIVHNCPVEFCGSSSKARITWPVNVGDTCEIRFASASIVRWVKQGGLVDPGEDRRHDPTDGVCFVGLHDSAHVPTDAPTDAIVVHTSGGILIKLGSSAAHEAAVAGDTYLAAENTLIAATQAMFLAVDVYAAAVAVVLPVTSPAAGAIATAFTTYVAAITAYNAAAAGFKATKVKVE